MKGGFQSLAARAEQGDGPFDGPDRPLQIGRIGSPYLTEREAQLFTRCEAITPRAFRARIRRAGVPVRKVFGQRLYERAVLVAFAEGKAWTSRRRSA